MEISNLIPHIEALIFASDKPLTPAEITELINGAFGFMEDKVVPEQVDAALEGIIEKYNSEFYPFEVRQSGGGWQFLTKKDYHKTVAQLNGEKFLKRLSAAALETLAIIAYKQPITKGEIESIRGVSSDYSVQKLLEKELIIISGRNEKLPGHPLIYATSKSFMDYFGINSPEDLPKIREVLAEQVVEPTIVSPSDFETSNLVVTDEGELVGEDAGQDGGDGPDDKEKPEVNGHAFPLLEDEEGDLDEEGNVMREDTDDEAATEEFIADQMFIEGDEMEQETETAQDDDLPVEDDLEERLDEPGPSEENEEDPGNDETKNNS